MRIRVTLMGPGGELGDCQFAYVADLNDEEELSDRIWEAINREHWFLAPGDTIKIEEIPEAIGE